MRMNNSPYRWNDIPWIPVSPGTELPERFQGRYIQIAADFYPGEGGESSPYLAELRLVYRAAEPPPPPTLVNAVAKNGAVELSWRPSVSRETGGYFVYYGTAKGEYFGEKAVLGSELRASPVDVGNRTSIRIDGLDNGTLYYFAVAAYNRPLQESGGSIPEPGLQVHEPGLQVREPGLQVREPGEFSREAAARPLRMAE